MINDDELIGMIRASATEQLPIAVMTVKEMRQFAQEVARDCLRLGSADKIKERYELTEH